MFGVFLICLAFAAAVLLSIQYAPAYQTLERDSGMFLYAGEQILHGKLPYVDFWDHKPPLVYLLNAAGLAMGKGRWGVWFIETLMFSASVAVLCLVLWRRLGTVAAVAGTALLIYAVRNGAFLEAGGNLTEGYSAYLLTFVLAGLLWHPVGSAGWAAMGVAGAMIFFLKQSCIVGPTAVGIVLAVAAVRQRQWARIQPLVFYAAGAMGTVALAVALMGATGILREFWIANFTFNRIYIDESLAVRDVSLRKTFTMLSQNGLLYLSILSMVGCLLRLLPPKGLRADGGSRLLAGAVAIAIPLEIAGISLPGYFFGHYYLTLLPMIAMGLVLWVSAGSAWACALMERARLRMKHPAIVPWALTAAAVLTFTGPLAVLQQGSNFSRAFAPKPASEDRALLEYLSAFDPNCPLLMWGAEPKYNYLTHRSAPTRYCYNYPLRYAEFDQPARFAEFMEQLKSRPDTIIIDADGLRLNTMSAPYIGRPIPPELLGQLKTYLAEHYRLTRVFGVRVGPERWQWFAYLPKAAKERDSRD